MSDETTTAKNSFPIPTKPASTKQPSELVAALKKGLSSADVFETFEALDAFPPDTVRAALEPWTGPAPSTDRLDARLRAAIGLPGKTPTFHCTRLRRPSLSDELSALDQEQIRRAGTGWDDRDLDATARLEEDGSESSFAGTLELISLSDASESSRYDVVRFRTGNGMVFHAGTSKIAGVLADGVVELSNHEDRVALQNVLSAVLVVKAAKAAAKATDVHVVGGDAKARDAATKTSAVKTSATATKAATKAAEKTTPKAAAKKKAAAVKTSTAKAVTAKPTSKKAAAKATAKNKKAKTAKPTKPVAAKTASKKTAAKAVASKANAKKAGSAKKASATAKKTASSKKSAATTKKATAKAATKATRAKATASKRAKAQEKKPTAKTKGAAPKAASKKATARRSPARKGPARKGARTGRR